MTQVVSGPIVLFRGGFGYRAVRIPAIAAVDEHRLVAVAVGRRRISDFGPSDLLIRRSEDGGKSWGRTRSLVRGWWRTVDNPTLLFDSHHGSLHVFFQSDYRRLWQRTSTDGGLTFGPPIDRSSVARSASGREFRIDRFAPGPGSGAVLSGGRLVVPLWGSAGRLQRPSVVFTIVSDDLGLSWQPGEFIAGPAGRYPNPTEATVAPSSDGGAVASFRQSAVPHRVFSWSADGASGWSTPRPAPELFEPVCHSALAPVGAPNSGSLAFANPDSRDSASPPLPGGKRPRENLTVFWSRDGGRSWGSPEVIDPGPSGYSALAADPSGALHVVWERGRLSRTAFWPTSIAYERRRGSETEDA